MWRHAGYVVRVRNANARAAGAPSRDAPYCRHGKIARKNRAASLSRPVLAFRFPDDRGSPASGTSGVSGGNK